MKRQIVQIAAMGDGVGLFALCSDGSAWELSDEAHWLELPPIPQDPEPPEVTELRKFVEGNGDDRP
jgi:hypothetical protein